MTHDKALGRPEKIATLQVGDEVILDEPTSGGNILHPDAPEITLDPGSVGVVESIDFLGGSQGWAVTMQIEGFAGEIANTFDEADPNPFPWRPLPARSSNAE